MGYPAHRCTLLSGRHLHPRAPGHEGDQVHDLVSQWLEPRGGSAARPPCDLVTSGLTTAAPSGFSSSWTYTQEGFRTPAAMMKPAQDWRHMFPPLISSLWSFPWDDNRGETGIKMILHGDDGSMKSAGRWDSPWRCPGTGDGGETMDGVPWP